MGEATYHSSADGEEALGTLKGQGFRLPDKPDLDPALPADLSDLDDDALMEEFALFTAWADYASAQVGLAVISERKAERDLEWITGLFWSNAPRSRAVTAIKAEASQDPDVREAQEALDKAYAYRRLVSDMAARYERDANVLSRELTRRTQIDTRRRERWSS